MSIDIKNRTDRLASRLEEIRQASDRRWGVYERWQYMSVRCVRERADRGRQTVDVEAVEGAVVALGRRAVGEGDAAAVEAGVGLAHGAHVDGAAAETQAAVRHAPHAPAPAVGHARRALAAVPREDRLALKNTKVPITSHLFFINKVNVINLSCKTPILCWTNEGLQVRRRVNVNSLLFNYKIFRDKK